MRAPLTRSWPAWKRPWWPGPGYLPHQLWFRMRRGPRQQQANRPLAGAYVAAPVGVLVPTAPESGLGDIHMVTMVIAPDRAFLALAGRVADPDNRSLHRDPWPVFGGTGRPAAADDRGNRYELHEDSAWSDGDGEWGGTLRLAPIPPAGTQWLELTMSPGSAPVRVDLSGACADAALESVPAGQPGRAPDRRRGHRSALPRHRRGGRSRALA